MKLANMGTSHNTVKSTQVHAIATTSARKKKQPYPILTDITTNMKTKPCYRCYGACKQEQCPFKGAECYKCLKISVNKFNPTRILGPKTLQLYCV